MKFGLNVYVWTTNLTADHYRVFPLVKRLGYDGIELPVSPDNAVNYLELRQLLLDHDLKCTTITNVGADADPISPDPTVRARGLDRLKWAVETSHLLGSEMLSGPYYAAYGVFSGRGPTEHELVRSAIMLGALVDYAKLAGVPLALEFLNRFETYLLNTVAQSKSLIERVNRPGRDLGILYDTHHAHHEEGDLAAAIALGGAAITHVHFSENQRGTLGSGLVDFAGTVSALRSIGYDRWVVAEAFNKDVPGLAAAAHVWRNCFQSPEQFAADSIGFLRQVWGNRRQEPV